MSNDERKQRSKDLGAAVHELAKMPSDSDEFLKVSSSHSVFNEDVEPDLIRPISKDNSNLSKFNDRLVKHQDQSLIEKFKESLLEMAVFALQGADVDFKGILEDIQAGNGVVFCDLSDLEKSKEQLTTAGFKMHKTTVQLSLAGYSLETINKFDREELKPDMTERKTFYLAFRDISGYSSLSTTHIKRRIYVDY